MAKFPAVKFSAEPVTPGKVAQAVKEIGVKALGATDGGVVMIPVDEINVFPDLQPRVQGKLWDERVASIAGNIVTQGYLASKPLDLFVVSELPPPAEDGTVGKAVETIYIADGHTRFAAVQKAIESGAEIKAVPAIFRPTGTTIEQVMGDTVRNNTGEPLSPYELSVVVARLKETFGRSDDEIAATLGKTKRYVQDLLVLSTAPAAIRNSVLKGEIAAAEAVRTIRKEGGGKAAEKIKEAVEKAKAAGKDKATASTLKGKEKKTGKKASAEAAGGAEAPAPSTDTPAAGEGALPGLVRVTDETFLRSAMAYAVEHGKATDGIRWLRAFLDADATAISELEKYMGQPNGAWFDKTLRVAEDDLADL